MFLLLCTKVTQKGHGFRENLVRVIVSTFLRFMFDDQLLLVDVFSSQVYYLTYVKKQDNNVGLTVINRYHEKSIISI